MTEKDKLAVPGSSDSLVSRVKIGGGSALHARLAQQPLPPKPGAVATQEQPAGAAPLDLCATLQNRLGLMLDISGSMGHSEDRKMKIDHLKEAIQNFLQSCDFSNTSCALEPFPPMYDEDENEEVYTSEDFNDDDPLASLMPKKPKLKGKKRRVLTNIHGLLSAEIDSLKHHGGTPMAECMKETLSIYPLTRGILVSDGEADNRHDAVNQAYEWKKADIVVDCVHIGRSISGEATLKEIARITGGMFIKFDNVSNFAKNFKFLTPANRLYLIAGGANLIGAKEVK